MAVLTPQEFAKRWGGSALSGRSSYQQHFLNLCEMLNAPKPADVDGTGEFYTFEKGVEKSGGGKGFADVWYKDHFAIEYKGKHKDLRAAYGQLLQYRESLENPPLLVVTDIDRFEVHTNFTNSVKQVTTFELDDLLDPERLGLVWTDPEAFCAVETPEPVTEKAPPSVRRLSRLPAARG